MNIGKLARFYRWIEYAAFARALERCRFAHLAGLVSARRVLTLGEGDGRTLKRLLNLAPAAQIDVLELSPEMIALAQQRIGRTDRVTFRCGDARRENWPAHHYDAIVTHFFLDCFSEDDARRLVERLANALKPNGVWLLGEFAVPKDGWRRLHAQILVAIMYRFFAIATGLRTRSLPPIGQVMHDAGMHCVERTQQRAGLIISELWQSSSAPRT